MKAFLGFCVFIAASMNISFAQRTISECTVVYELSVTDTKADPEFVKSMAGTTKTIYLKGTKVRSDLQSPSFLQSTFKDSKSDTTTILREIGNAKYLTYLTVSQLKQRNDRYDGITFTPANDTKTILGYECKKVDAKLKDGSTYSVYFTSAIVPSNTDYEYQFRDLPGLVLEYETMAENGKATIKYSAVKISVTPVQSARFDIPKSGYRVLAQ